MDRKGSDGWKAMVTQPPVPKEPLEMLGREDWSALPPKWTKPLDLPVTKIFLVATQRPTCYNQRGCTLELQSIQNFHMKVSNIPDIRYNFVISGNGMVFEGRGWKNQPSLPLTYEAVTSKSFYIAMTGKFEDDRVAVPAIMLETLDLLLQYGVDYKYIDPDYETFDL